MQDVFKLKEIVRKKKVAKHRKRKLNVLKEYVKNTLMAIKQISDETIYFSKTIIQSVLQTFKNV